jgi:hypothetical protein
MKAKEFIPASKPRNFVAKNQKTAGAGAHKDKKRAEKQGDVKHKKDLTTMEQGVAEGSHTTEKQILTRIRQIMYDRKLSGTESNAGELHRLKQQLKDIRSQQGVREASDFGEPREILEDVLRTLEREVEWPLTDVMDPREVKQLLAPVVKAVNDKMMSMDRDGNQ